MTVGMQELLIFLAIGLVAGWLAGLVLGGGGLLRNLIVGVIGAFVGGWLLSVANISLPIGNVLLSQIITATIGALVVILAARLITR
ncbi:MAG TPA: GlsB/YeaQ/YmgE family stress response membrane protein [Devosia sp.]|nr:GlsB/YeaQ/YmgE family stress response membrane protein [Devosia sp.]